MSAKSNSSVVWKTPTSSVEIRTQGVLADGRAALDEIVADNATIHLEQMSHGHWWLGIQAGGRDFHLNFGIENGRLYVSLSDQDSEAAWVGDSREFDFFLKSNLRSESTGLPFVVWIGVKGDSDDAVRIHVVPPGVTHPSQFVTVAISPEVRAVQGTLDPGELELVRRWVDKNREVLVRHWEGEIDSAEAIAAIRANPV